MIGTVMSIIDNKVIVKLSIDINKQPSLVGLHAVFEDEKKKIVGEIVNISQTTLTAVVSGELTADSFIPGASKKPSFKSNVRLIKLEELELMLGKQALVDGQVNFGCSNVYEGYRINVDINDFFSNHFSVLGNSGSGKSCSVASIMQKLILNTKLPYNANFFFFDAFGEYNNAFATLHDKNPNFNYKYYTTNTRANPDQILRIPVWLLDVDDLALLLDAQEPSQLSIIEKTLKLVPILSGTSPAVVQRKNEIIARAILDILLSGNDSTKVRDQVTAVLTKFNTTELSLSSKIVQPGYVRTLKQCLYVDTSGKMQEMELVVEFIRSFIGEDEQDILATDLNPFYTLADLEMSMDFALVNEGILKSDKVFDYANILSVRIHTLVTGEYAKFFEYDKYVNKEQYINSLIMVPNTTTKAQIINFNINYVDDRMAKVITKILSKMLFDIASTTIPRGSRAFHIIIEEAHRYVIKDRDADLLGYNIFERITKEGRKYGIFLGLITQRPSELSDTCISQCTNFIILRILHPKDLEYIKNMVPNISAEIVQQLKNLKPGNCIAFGNAFKVPISMYVDLPDPRPMSNNVDLKYVWYHVNNEAKSELNDPFTSNIRDISTIPKNDFM